MSSKRKSPSNHGDHEIAHKRPKGQIAEEEEHPTNHADAHVDIATTNVNWALPTSDPKSNDRDQGAEITQYATLLYGQTWDHLTVEQLPFGFPRLRSPIHKGYTDTVKKPYSDENGTSRAVCDLFNLIKNDTKKYRQGVDYQPGPYSRVAFDEALHGGDVAVVASRSDANAVLALTEDIWVQVTIRDGANVESAHLQFVQRSIRDQAVEAEIGYFIQLPLGIKVTINGHTYINDRVPAENGETDGTAPFFIGPLTRYTVIELLSQPIFFFRRAADLDYTDPVVRGSRARPDTAERKRRDLNGDIEPENVEIIWTTALPQSSHGSAPPEDPPEPPEKPSGDNEPAEYKDDWSAEQRNSIIELGVHFQRRMFGGYAEDWPLDAINSILIGINERQTVDTGFSIRLSDTTLRPGRPLLIPHLINDHRILLVIQARSEGTVTIHILDPMLWSTTEEQRQQIINDVPQLVQSSNWLEGVFKDDKDSEDHLDISFRWAPCCQVLEHFDASILTILNAWALSLNLRPQHDHSLGERDRRRAFIQDAVGLIKLALDHNQLDWKLVLVFLQYWKFTQDDEESLPNNRRFDHAQRRWRLALQRQIDEDRTWRASENQLDMNHVRATMGIMLANSIEHDSLRDCENQTPDFEQNVVRPLVSRGLWRPNMTDQELEDQMQTLNADNAQGATSMPPSQPHVADQETEDPMQEWNAENMPPAKSLVPYQETEDPMQKLSAENMQETPSTSPSKQDLQDQDHQNDTETPKNVPKKSIADFTDDIQPCAYFRRAMTELRSSAEERLQTFRRSGGVSMARKDWLEDAEVSLAIGSVTQAITSIQDLSGGFSTVLQAHVQLAFFPDHSNDWEIAIRPGRPMLVPVNHEHHIVLLVVQTNEQERPTISVLDSKAYHYEQADRERIYQSALVLIRGTQWGRHVFEQCPTNKDIPNAMWIQCAQQPNHAECGYHAILNAWALALGLEVNPNFASNWNAQFFTDLQDVVHLARLGLADWRLITAFLRCNRFVHEGVVPPSRRFTQTLELLNEDALIRHLEALRDEEYGYWHPLYSSGPDLTAVRAQNRVNLPLGTARRHNDGTRFPSDQWGLHNKVNRAKPLAKIGDLPLDKSTQAIINHYQDRTGNVTEQGAIRLAESRANRFHAQITGREFTRDILLSRYADLMLNSAGTLRFNDRIFQHACMARTEGFTFLHNISRNSVASLMRGLPLPDRWNDLLFDDQVNMAIASVVQAIDRHQHLEHQRSSQEPFNGGFALATTLNVAQAAVDTDFSSMNEENPFTSRPRRCWFLPMTISELDRLNWARAAKKQEILLMMPENKPNRTHHFLTCVQEETVNLKRSGTCNRFRVHVLDSGQHHVTDKDANLVFQKVVNATYNLNWATHRNPTGEAGRNSRVTFLPRLRKVGVATQRHYAQCGHHTVLNAWILALGLTPNFKLTFNDALYTQLHELMRYAVAGLLHWQTPAAWLFCNDMVEQGENIRSIPQNRWFGLTVRQEEYEGVVERYVERARVEDDGPLQTLDVATRGYDLSSNINVNWEEDVGVRRPRLPFVDDGEDDDDDDDEDDNEEADGEEDEDDEEEEDEDDDPDAEGETDDEYYENEGDLEKALALSLIEQPAASNYPAQDAELYRVYEEVTAPLRRRPGCHGDVDQDGDVEMTDAHAQAKGKKRGQVDELLFLDAW